MEQQTNISQLDITQLKALAYDCLSNIELNQNNLRIINQELARKQQHPPMENQIEPLPMGSIQSV